MIQPRGQALPKLSGSPHVYQVVRTLPLALAAALMIAACADPTTGQAGAPGAAGPVAAASPTSTADCVKLGALAPAPVPPLDVSDLGDGAKRVTSAEGGYSLVVPGAWLVSGSLFGGGTIPAFGQAHMTSYDPRAAPTSRPEAGGMLPPDVGIRFDIELWANPFGEGADAFALRIRIGPDQTAVLPGSFVTIDGRRAYLTTIQDERRFQPNSGPLITTRQTRAVWIVPTPRADRMLVLYATPTESSLLSAVERAVSTLHVTAPTRSTGPVVHQRSEILGRWLVGKSGPIPGRRAEAKLMTYAEASVALHPGGANATPNGVLRIDHDPEDLFWLVAVSGPDLPQGRGGLHGTPPPTAWMLYTTAATEGRGASTGIAYSAAGTWPPGFDQLPDRCH
jgi:hypothetical protein